MVVVRDGGGAVMVHVVKPFAKTQIKKKWLKY